MTPGQALRYELVSYADIARATKVSRKTLRNWVAADRAAGLTIPYVRRGRGVLFRVSDALGLLDRHVRFHTKPPERGRL